jgi:N-ethylmaleimide reductase
MSTQSLFSSYSLGRITLKNRVVMAPMTRNRALGNVPNELMATYYAQRADAGLIVTEGTSPSPNGLGYARIPGLFSAEQVAGWRKVTDAVHAEGGRIFVQLMHTGRASHEKNLPAGAHVLAPSAIALSTPLWVDPDGNLPPTTPKAMSSEEVASTIGEYARAAELAIEAGFDGVELHGANGYLIDQFLNVASNQRDDVYGGSVENRARFALDVARAAAKAIGGDRVGIRVSPYGVFNDMTPDAETDALYLHLASELSALGLVYLHVVDHSSMGAPEVSPTLKAKLRATFKGTSILSGGYDRARAEADLTESKGDLVAFGRPYISNPRLAHLLEADKPLAAPDFGTFYTPGEKGYTDYPVV